MLKIKSRKGSSIYYKLCPLFFIIIFLFICGCDSHHKQKLSSSSATRLDTGQVLEFKGNSTKQVSSSGSSHHHGHRDHTKKVKKVPEIEVPISIQVDGDDKPYNVHKVYVAKGTTIYNVVFNFLTKEKSLKDLSLKVCIKTPRGESCMRFKDSFLQHISNQEIVKKVDLATYQSEISSISSDSKKNNTKVAADFKIEADPILKETIDRNVQIACYVIKDKGLLAENQAPDQVQTQKKQADNEPEFVVELKSNIPYNDNNLVKINDDNIQDKIINQSSNTNPQNNNELYNKDISQDKNKDKNKDISQDISQDINKGKKPEIIHRTTIDAEVTAYTSAAGALTRSGIPASESVVAGDARYLNKYILMDSPIGRRRGCMRVGDTGGKIHDNIFDLYMGGPHGQEKAIAFGRRGMKVYLYDNERSCLLDKGNVFKS